MEARQSVLAELLAAGLTLHAPPITAAAIQLSKLCAYPTVV